MDGIGRKGPNEWNWMDRCWWTLDKRWWMLDGIVTNDDEQRCWQNCDGQQLRQQQQWCYKVVCVRELCIDGVKKRREIFFLLLRVFFIKIIFFASSTDLATWSSNHLCKEPAEMEIDKWSLKKWRKLSVYWSRFSSINLLEELEQQRN
jgi:hypothetical protein